MAHHPRERQQAAVSELGVQALERAGDIQALLEAAGAKVCDALRIDMCAIMEVDARGEKLTLRAGSGWPREAMGRAVWAGPRSPAGRALHDAEPVIIEDLRHDRRFDDEPLLRGVVSGLTVPIKGDEGAFGVLGAYTTVSRRFVRHDASFLQSVANVIANAVRNHRTMRRLEANERRLALVLEGAQMGMWEVSLESGQAVWNRREFELLGLPPAPRAHVEQFWERVHPDDRSWLRAAVSSAIQFGEDYDVEFRVVLPSGEERWLAGRARVLEEQGQEPRRLLGVNFDITERKRAEEALAASEERYRRISEELETLYHSAPIGLAVLDRDLRFVRLNEELARINGLRVEEHIGRPAHEVFPGLHDAVRALRQVVERGEPLLGAELEGAAGAHGERSGHWLCSYVPLRGASGEVEAVSCVVQDISERKDIERHQQLLLAELGHRVKNMLSTVLSIAGRTMRNSDSIETFQEAFEGRILALSRAHDLITRVKWGSIELRELAGHLLEPYVEDEHMLEVEGEAVQLPPRAAVSLTMVLHELTTNAAKYGCLSRPAGRVHLRWHFEAGGGERHLLLEWEERGGPEVSPPAEEGLGSQIIRSTMEYELRGSVSIRYEPQGMRCRLRMPWKEPRPPLAPRPSG